MLSDPNLRETVAVGAIAETLRVEFAVKEYSYAPKRASNGQRRSVFEKQFANPKKSLVFQWHF